MCKYRIIMNGKGLYGVEVKNFFGFWDPIMQWDGCDLLGFDYGFSEMVFKTIEDAEEYINELENKGKRTVIKEL